LEEELNFDWLKLEKKLERKGDKATDFLKTQVLDAKYRYEFISETLGPQSPAKSAAIEAERAARAEAAL